MVRAVRGVAALLILAACDRGQPSEDLDRLHDEAVAANRDVVAALKLDRAETDSLPISGRVERPEVLEWDKLQTLATTHVQTIDPQATGRTTPTDFRGVLVRDLLDRARRAPDADRDHVRVARRVPRDRSTSPTRARTACCSRSRPTARRSRRTTAARSSSSIPTSESSPAYRRAVPRPVLGVLRHARWWSAPRQPRLQVGGTTLDRARARRAAGERRFDAGPAGRSTGRATTGPPARRARSRDVLAAAGVELPPRGTIVVRGKAPVHHDPRQAVGHRRRRTSTRCPPLLALALRPRRHADPGAARRPDRDGDAAVRRALRRRSGPALDHDGRVDRGGAAVKLAARSARGSCC